jgi:hypothetical protein
VLWRDERDDKLLASGLAVTIPTGPDHFANSPVFVPVHTTVLTPFVGSFFRCDRWYAQGFLSPDVPAEEKDATLIHNDIQVGYILHPCTDEGAWLTAVMPHFEAHLNDPLNHRRATNPADPVGTPDELDLMAGVTFELRRTATLAVGFVTPVTGPNPYGFEVLAGLNVRFGCTRARAQHGAAGQTQTGD